MYTLKNIKKIITDILNNQVKNYIIITLQKLSVGHFLIVSSPLTHR